MQVTAGVYPRLRDHIRGRLSMRSRQLISLSFLLILVLLPAAFAQNTTTYTIALAGGRWNTHTITVKIPQSPEKAHEAVVWGMLVWNLAQVWFAQKYYPDSPTYTLVESNTTALVQVAFAKPGYAINCGGVWADGCTWYHNGVGTQVEIVAQSNPDGSVDSQPGIQYIAEHEFGHVFGLQSTTLRSDLEWPNRTAIYSENGILQISPSTLDLYAVHFLISSTGRVPASVALPSSIPYIMWPVQPVPEFSAGFIVLICALLSACLVLAGIRSKRPRVKTSSPPIIRNASQSVKKKDDLD
jgi:hypothetical protein